MPNSSLTSRNDSESQIRTKIIQSGIVEAIITFPPGLFYTTKVPFCVWILDKARSKALSVLFVDVPQLETKKQKALTAENCNQLIELVTDFRKGRLSRKNKGIVTATLEDIAKKEYILSPNLYMKTNFEYTLPSSKGTSDFAECIVEIKSAIANENLISQLDQWTKDSDQVNWVKASLLGLYDIFGGLSTSKAAFGQGYPFLDIKTIIHSPFLPNTFPKKVQVFEVQRQKYNIRYGDVFLNRTSESVKELGCCCVATRDCEAVYTSFAKRLRPKTPNVIDPFYAAGYFQSGIYRKQIMDVSTVFTHAPA